MNTRLLINTIHRGTTMLVPKISGLASGRFSMINRNFHIIQNVVPKLNTIIGRENNTINPLNLLQPTQYLLTQVCGMKVKGKLSLRCRDCYYIACKGRWYVRCKTHPRHKQAEIVKREKNTWILTSVCQHKKRPWW